MLLPASIKYPSTKILTQKCGGILILHMSIRNYQQHNLLFE
ncbi:unnamed protein product [Paramecium sonneborni]|uniref:Uncharacterized protein n=1 Tax=Paramecium sonneborni TaxID=65129 RepID=A0A8S1LW40_9CILI|nr:unnamed protein product [Paramecium sonneborni]